MEYFKISLIFRCLYNPENMKITKKKRTLLIAIASTVCLSGLFTVLRNLDISLSSTRSYCINRNLLIMSLPAELIKLVNSNSFRGSVELLHHCTTRNQPPVKEFLENVNENYQYTVDVAKILAEKRNNSSSLPNVSESFLKSSQEPWQYKLESGTDIPEFSAKCVDPSGKQKCVVVKFHVFRNLNKSPEAYCHYLILMKDSNGKFNSVLESFGISPLKG
jgi:hypothetical protein